MKILTKKNTYLWPGHRHFDGEFVYLNFFYMFTWTYLFGFIPIHRKQEVLDRYIPLDEKGDWI